MECFCWHLLKLVWSAKDELFFKSIHAYRLQKGTMVVSLGFSMVLLSLLLFTVLMIMVMSVAVCLSRTHGRVPFPNSRQMALLDRREY